MNYKPYTTSNNSWEDREVIYNDGQWVRGIDRVTPTGIFLEDSTRFFSFNDMLVDLSWKIDQYNYLPCGTLNNGKFDSSRIYSYYTRHKVELYSYCWVGNTLENLYSKVISNDNHIYPIIAIKNTEYPFFTNEDHSYKYVYICDDKSIKSPFKTFFNNRTNERIIGIEWTGNNIDDIITFCKEIEVWNQSYPITDNTIMLSSKKNPNNKFAASIGDFIIKFNNNSFELWTKDAIEYYGFKEISI